MSGLRSTVWGAVTVVAIVLIALIAYSSCYTKP
jgi:hypothetical protein